MINDNDDDVILCVVIITFWRCAIIVNFRKTIYCIIFFIIYLKPTFSEFHDITLDNCVYVDKFVFI